MAEEFIRVVLRGGAGTILLDPEQYDYEAVHQELLGTKLGVGPHDLHEFQAASTEGGHYLAIFRREEVAAVLSPILP